MQVCSGGGQEPPLFSLINSSTGFPTSSPLTSWPQGLRDYVCVHFWLIFLFLFIRDTGLPTKACNEQGVARALTMNSWNSRQKQS